MSHTDTTAGILKLIQVILHKNPYEETSPRPKEGVATICCQDHHHTVIDFTFVDETWYLHEHYRSGDKFTKTTKEIAAYYLKVLFEEKPHVVLKVSVRLPIVETPAAYLSRLLNDKAISNTTLRGTRHIITDFTVVKDESGFTFSDFTTQVSRISG